MVNGAAIHGGEGGFILSGFLRAQTQSRFTVIKIVRSAVALKAIAILSAVILPLARLCLKLFSATKSTKGTRAFPLMFVPFVLLGGGI